ncbi:MAG: hypothetical protein H6834_12210 [Planctomycetes bacterium]|nr:hypothetical protein [Planctomycetota bacterium]
MTDRARTTASHPSTERDLAGMSWLAQVSWKARSGEGPDELLRREYRVRILLRRDERMILKLYRERPWLYWRNVLRRAPAAREHQGLVDLWNAGVRAPEPGVWGQERPLGIYTRSFLTMEFVDGAEPLKDYLKREDLTRGRRRAVLDELARQVARMHAAHIWHGRLTPKNVLVRDGVHPEVFLIDAIYCLRFPKGLPALARRLDLLHLLGRDSLSRTEKLRFARTYGGVERPSYWKAIQRRRGVLRKLWEELTYPCLASFRWVLTLGRGTGERLGGTTS